jgi:hypothetical protein
VVWGKVDMRLMRKTDYSGANAFRERTAIAGMCSMQWVKNYIKVQCTMNNETG